MIALWAAALLAASPLADLAASLRSADEASARPLLERLGAARSGALGLPDEWLNAGGPASLSARTLDDLLVALAALRTRVPSLSPEIDALVQTWDACSLGAFDLRDERGYAVRVPAAPRTKGLTAFGFLAGDGGPGPRCTAPPEPPPFIEGHLATHSTPVPEFAAPSFTAIPSGTIGPTGTQLGGRVYASWLLRGQVQVGASATWTPWKFLFVRAGAGWQAGWRDAPGDPSGPFATWGFGWDDWHDNTFSVQINHWEPHFASRGADLGRALLNVGYKLPRLCRHKLCLATYAFVETPLENDVAEGRVPTAGLRFTFTPREDLFIMLGAAVTLRGDTGVRWVYGAGRWSWRPWTTSLSYENWGPNAVPDPNFLHNGQLTAALNWSL